MSDQFSALGSALYARLGTVQYTYRTNGTVTVTGTLPTYDSLAPQGTNPPYVIFQLASSLDRYQFGGDAGESADYLIKVVSDRQYASAQAFGIYHQAHTQVQDAPLVVANNQLLRCRRSSRFQYPDAEQYWHVGGYYRIDTWQT